MRMDDLVRRLQKSITDNSPAILTGIGVTGTLLTAYLAGRATVQATKIVEFHELKEGPAEGWQKVRERVQLTWKLYIPAAASATTTIAAIISANQVSSRRAAAVAAAYTTIDRAFSEYREKMVETIGKNKEERARAEIAQERVNENPPVNVIVTGRGETLCFEAYTGRSFYSDMEALRKAQNDLNAQIINQGFASLTDFYDMIGLKKTAHSDEFGWTADKLLELRFAAVLHEGQPVMSVEYNHIPIR